MRALGAARRNQAVADHARRADVPGQPGMDLAQRGQFVHRREVDLFLRVETGAHQPLVHQRDQRPRLHHAQRLGVGQDVHRELERHVQLEQPVLGVPRRAHRAVVGRLGDRVGGDEPRCHVVGRRRVDVRHQRPAGRHHAVALVLRVGGVAQPLLERVGRMLQRAHQRRVIRHVHHFEAIAVPRGVQHPVDRLVVVHVVGGQAEGRPHGVGHRRLGARRVVDQARHTAAQARSNAAANASPPARACGNETSGS